MGFWSTHATAVACYVVNVAAVTVLARDNARGPNVNRRGLDGLDLVLWRGFEPIDFDHQGWTKRRPVVLWEPENLSQCDGSLGL